MRKVMIAGMCFCLSGCLLGEKFPFTDQGSAIIYGDRICISVDKKDVLDFYSISSSENNYKKELVNSGDTPLQYRYPKTCFSAPLKNGFEYVLLYKMNSHTFRYEFFIDLNGRVFDIRRGNE
jgi:hypothetical protein